MTWTPKCVKLLYSYKEYNISIPEKQLIVLLLNNNNYNKYNELVNVDYIKETFRELSYIYTTLFELHEKHPTKDLTLDELNAFFWVKYPQADKPLYEAIFDSLSELKISDDVGEGILREIKSRSGALKLSEEAYRVAQGNADPTVLNDLWDKWIVRDDHQLTADGITDVNADFLEIMERVNTTEGRRWRLDCLNKSLGSLRPGDFGFIFARPETGKTTFLASEITSSLLGATQPTIWFNNEEQGWKVMFRVLQAYFGVTSDVIMSNIKHYHQRFNEETNNGFQLRDAATLSRHEIEKIIEKHNPNLVI